MLFKHVLMRNQLLSANCVWLLVIVIFSYFSVIIIIISGRANEDYSKIQGKQMRWIFNLVRTPGCFLVFGRIQPHGQHQSLESSLVGSAGGIKRCLGLSWRIQSILIRSETWKQILDSGLKRDWIFVWNQPRVLCKNNCPFSHFSDCAPAFVAPQGRSEETARRLWQASCELLGIEWDWFSLEAALSFSLAFCVLYFEGVLHNEQSGNPVKRTIMWSFVHKIAVVTFKWWEHFAVSPQLKPKTLGSIII